MNIADLSIRRPIFVTSLVFVMVAVGFLFMKRMPVDLFPNITFPIVTVTVVYPGAGPKEMETLVAKPLEDELGTVNGIKRMRSISKDGVSTVVAEFTLETDVKYAEQQIRDRLSSARRKLPDDIKEPIVRRIDPADQPILVLSLTGDKPEAELYDLADQIIRPRVEQVQKVGLVEVIGGRKREIRIELDRRKLKAHEISATAVAQRIALNGQNIPAGKITEAGEETVVRTVAEFRTLKEIEDTVVNFAGNDVPVTVRDLGRVVDDLQDETSRTFANGKRALFLMVFRQSGANTIAVSDAVRKRTAEIQKELVAMGHKATLTVERDTARMIRANVDDVRESILIGIALTLLVVYFFLGNARSTFITGIALPNSLIGAFILMGAAGFTINVMSLLALSLAVGLLVDDAIVVRENIFRHIELGKEPREAASVGTREVLLAVVATTLTVIAVFGPIGFLQGVVGQFFKEFGLTICFAMAISFFDAVTMAPMLSAYFAGNPHAEPSKNPVARALRGVLKGFDRFQDGLTDRYEGVLRFTLARPKTILASSVALFFVSLGAAGFVPKTFLPAQEMGEFMVSLELPPGSSLEATAKVANEVDELIRRHPEIVSSIQVVGNRDNEVNKAELTVAMVPMKQRRISTTEMKQKVRDELKSFAQYHPVVKDIDMVAAGMRPFNLNIVGDDLKVIEGIAMQAFARLKDHPALKDPELSHQPGKPEFQVNIDNRRAERMGVSSLMLGAELRTQMEGSTPAVFRQNEKEYDIRVRLLEAQRNLQRDFAETYVPNLNQSLIRVDRVAEGVATSGPANITRQDRGRYIQIGADITPGGPGMGAVMSDIDKMFKTDIKLPPGVRYVFVGQAENFKELGENMLVATGLGILFIFLVLSSLYESFVTPLTIMLVLPLAAVGAFFALFVTHQSLDIYSMIGCVMLLGIATKNSILLVDYTAQLIREGWERNKAILEAGRVRLRPILMTSVALIAGMLPVAIGLNEASRQRVSMGIAIIGGLISSTLLTLVVVPAAYRYIDDFRLWIEGVFNRMTGRAPQPATAARRRISARVENDVAASDVVAGPTP